MGDNDEHHASIAGAVLPHPVLAPPIPALLPAHNAHDTCHAPAESTPSPGNQTVSVRPVKPDTDTDTDAGTRPILLPHPSSLSLSLTNPTWASLHAKHQLVPSLDAPAVVDAPNTREWHSFARPDASATPEHNTGLGAGYFSVSTLYAKQLAEKRVLFSSFFFFLL